MMQVVFASVMGGWIMSVCVWLCAACRTQGRSYTGADHLVVRLGLWTGAREGRRGHTEAGEEEARCDDMEKLVVLAPDTQE